MSLRKTTPILRIFDEARAREFYIDFLGFRSDWEHRFEPDLPLYMQVSRDDCILHLSGHHGDCCPGAALRIESSDLDAFHAELSAKRYKHARPGIETKPWGTRDMSVTDPFGNRLTFWSPVAAPRPADLDAMTAAPHHHAVLLENDQVRVLDTRLGPGEVTPVHTHPWPSVLYVLSWSDFVRCDAAGQILLDSRALDTRPVAGTALWSEPLGPHSARNVGERELRVVAVELKRPPA